MSISYQADSSIVLRTDHDPPRSRTIAAGSPRSEQEAIILAFFAADADDPPAVVAADVTARP